MHSKPYPASRKYWEILVSISFAALTIGVLTLLVFLTFHSFNDASVVPYHMHLMGVSGVLMVAVVTGAFQFSSTIFRKNRGVHFLLGNIYLLMVLFIGTPGALILGRKELSWQWMLPLIGLVLYGWKSARIAILKVAENDWTGHAAWMMRSYACTLLLSLLWSGYMMQLKWTCALSILMPVLAEVLFRKGFPKKMVKDFFSK